MATLAEYRFLPIQVSTRLKKKVIWNMKNEKNMMTVANWELNQDNEIGAENRCVEVRCINLMRLLKIDIIKKHLLSYDYSAALEVGKRYSGRFVIKSISVAGSSRSTIFPKLGKNESCFTGKK